MTSNVNTNIKCHKTSQKQQKIFFYVVVFFFLLFFRNIPGSIQVKVNGQHFWHNVNYYKI